MKTQVAHIVCILLASTCLYADVYKWVDENGRVHYGDQPANSESITIDIENKNIIETIKKKDPKQKFSPINFRVELIGTIGMDRQHDAFAILTKNQPDVAGRVLINYRHSNNVIPLQARFKEVNGNYLITKDEVDHPEWVVLNSTLDMSSKKLIGTLTYIQGKTRAPVKIYLTVTKATSYNK